VFYALVTQSAAADAPSRAGLALRTAPIEALASAVQAAPDALEALESYNLAGEVPTQNGFSRPLVNARQVRLSEADLLRPTPFALAGGVATRSPSGGLVWSGEVRVDGAHALRLHLGSVALPAGARVWSYTPEGDATAAYLAGLAGSDELWTGLAHGESLWLEVEVPAAALHGGGEARFTLDRVLELVALDPEGRPVVGPGVHAKSDHCSVDVHCAAQTFPQEVARIKEAVARIFFVKNDSGFICSGGLLEDTDPNTDRALFLTANHCIPDQTIAATVVSFFRLWHVACGSSQENSPDRVDGAKLLATFPASDSSLIELAGLPPNPKLLPVDGDAAGSAVGTIIDDVSLPGGHLQVFSRHRIVPECSGPNTFSGTTLFGNVRGGSSGSLAVNDKGKVVGQLGGVCWSSGEPDLCSNPDAWAFFGRLSAAFPTFAQFLDPPDAGFFQSTAFPDFAFKVEITAGDESRLGKREATCLPETECVSGALPGRVEVLLRIIGPRPNGKLWPTLVKFTTSRVDVWIRQLSTGIEKHYVLEGAAPGIDELPGLFDRLGFDP
jgi:hypothetical protein